MRSWLIAAIFLAMGRATAQQPTPSKFDETIPDLFIRVQKHSTGADLVEITTRDAEFPAASLEVAAQELGAQVGDAPRGFSSWKVQLRPDNPNLDLVKASFGMAGLIDRANGLIKIGTIAKCFAPYTKAISVIFEGESPNKLTLRSVDNGTVWAEARIYRGQPGGSDRASTSIEYRVRFLTSDPSKIDFPDQLTEQTEAKKPSGNPVTASPLLYVGAGLMGLAAWALVYWLSLNRGSRKGN